MQQLGGALEVPSPAPAAAVQLVTQLGAGEGPLVQPVQPATKPVDEAEQAKVRKLFEDSISREWFGPNAGPSAGEEDPVMKGKLEDILANFIYLK